MMVQGFYSFSILLSYMYVWSKKAKANGTVETIAVEKLITSCSS